jgi:hypothetical protein
MNIIVLFDNDDNMTGQNGAKAIEEECSRYYNVSAIVPPKNDIGDMSVKEIQDVLIPQIKRFTYE